MIKEKRKLKNLTQEEMAEKLGVSLRQYVRIDNEKAFPRRDILKKIIKELNKCSKYFKTKHNNVHLNITDNRLSELSQYAITPVELQKFLADNKRKFTELHKS